MNQQIIAEYTRRRAEALADAQARQEKIFAEHPALSRAYDQVEEAMRSFVLRRAREQETSSQAVKQAKAIYLEELARSGHSTQDWAPRYRCPHCQDTGYVGALSRVPCRCLRLLLLEDELGIPVQELYQRENFASYDPARFSDRILEGVGASARALAQKVRGWVLNWCEALPHPTPSTLLLMGNTGTGKSFLLHCVGAYALDRGMDFLPIDARTASLWMRAATFGDAETERILYSTPLLLLDDLGSEPYLPNLTPACFFSLIESRQRAGLATAIATNLSPGDIQTLYSERLLSRFTDPSRTRQLVLMGEDLRTAAGNRSNLI